MGYIYISYPYVNPKLRCPCIINLFIFIHFLFLYYLFCKIIFFYKIKYMVKKEKQKKIFIKYIVKQY